jgi:hypothetical protein
MPQGAPRWRAPMPVGRNGLPAASFLSLDVSMDHRVKPGGDDVNDRATAVRRVATAKRYAGPVWLRFVGPLETANLDLAAVFHAGPMRTLVVAVTAYHANLRQRACAFRGLRAFGRILRPSADAHECARRDDCRKQYRTSHGHDFSPIDVIREEQVDCRRVATPHREPACGPRRSRRQSSRKASDRVHGPQSEIMSQ